MLAPILSLITLYKLQYLTVVQVDRISIEASFCSSFNDREHRPADGQPAEVEAVLARELLRGGHCFYTGDSFQYKLKWKGWSVREATWEPESNCVALGVEEMIRSFDDQHPIRGQSTLCCGNGQVLDSYTNLDIETSY